MPRRHRAPVRRRSSASCAARSVAIVASLVVAVLVVAMVAAVVPTSGANVQQRRPCGDAVRRVSGARTDAPVLFVHGFAGGPSNFRAERDDRPSMLTMVGDVPRVATYTFSYSRDSLAWVSDPTIGPALASAIACIADVHDRRVVVVAHSMGGLATQFAQGQTVDGRPVATRVGDVITVGTPFEGAQLLSFASGAGGVVFDAISDAALDTCDETDRASRARDFCGLLGTTETPAVQAMIPGSSQLDALPPWQPGVVVHPIAGDIDVTIDVFGLEQEFGVGDLAVSVDSALAGASRGIEPFVAGCRTGFFDIVAAIDDSPCSHTNELANRRIERRVRHLVRDAVRRSRAR
jgi:pimeloyl-ACP methyl ester carboxylesterase